MRACQPKDAKNESGGAGQRVGGGVVGRGEKEREKEHTHVEGGERERESTLAPPFICFFLPLGLPYANWA